MIDKIISWMKENKKTITASFYTAAILFFIAAFIVVLALVKNDFFGICLLIGLGLLSGFLAKILDNRL